MKIAILMGSPNDADKMAPASTTLESFGVESVVHVMSAHRSPTKVAAFAASARAEGFAAVICGAGMAAHLAGAVAANTTPARHRRPVVRGAIGGIYALYATVQMPRGIPVATVAVDGAMNAALLAIQILAVTDERLASALDAQRAENAG